MNEDQEKYLKGFEDAVNHIDSVMKDRGGATRVYEVQTYQIKQMLEFVKTGESNIYNKFK